MKIRIKGNSLRYRLTRTDVDHLAKDGHLQEATIFADSVLTYTIHASVHKELTATYINNNITLFVPVTMINELANTNKVGFEGNEGELHLLIEKDFTCLDNVAEDQSDNYPNPLADTQQ